MLAPLLVPLKSSTSISPFRPVILPALLLLQSMPYIASTVRCSRFQVAVQGNRGSAPTPQGRCHGTRTCGRFSSSSAQPPPRHSTIPIISSLVRLVLGSRKSVLIDCGTSHRNHMYGQEKMDIRIRCQPWLRIGDDHGFAVRLLYRRAKF